MVLDLLPVEAKAQVSIFLLVDTGELLRGGGAKRDALVGWAEENVKLELGVRGGVLGDCACVGLADATDGSACAEQTAVQEVGRLTARLELEVAKGKNARGNGELD